MQRGTYGFWRGALAGLVVVIVAALALAWLYPPLRAPEVDEGMQVPPAPPSAPPGVAADGASGPMLTPAPGPIVDGVGSPPAHPEAPAADAPAGSPSLVPAQ